MKLLVATLLAALTFAGSTDAQTAADHLKCFKVKDPQARIRYLADLSGLVAQSGCTIKVPAFLACVPASKANVQPAPPGGGGTGTPNAFGCYKIKCPKGTVAPPLELNDQFGNRIVTPITSKLICAPAAVATTCVPPFEPSLAALVDAFAAHLDAFEIAGSCGGTPAVCCPGGVPTAPCGPLHADLTGASFEVPVGANRVDVTLRMHLETVSDVPVTIPAVGDCLMQIDTSPGASSTIQANLPLNLSADGLHVESIGTVAITDFTADDVALGGSLGCQLANLGISIVIGQLTDTLGDQLRQFEGLCLGQQEAL